MDKVKGPVWETHQSESVWYIVSSKSPISDPPVVSVFLGVEFQAIADKKRDNVLKAKEASASATSNFSLFSTTVLKFCNPVSGSDVIGAWLYDREFLATGYQRSLPTLLSPGGG